MYDWSNSVYALTITTAIFPSYFFAVTGGKGSTVRFFDLHVNNTVLYSYTLAAAFLVVAFFNPILSGIADASGNKKRFMQFFCYLGAFSCIMLFFFDKNSIELGVLAFGFAAIGFAGSLVFYNSFLPEIATEEHFDAISAKGFSLGYIGSVILLVANLVLILQPTWFGINPQNTSLAPRLSFLSVGVWWAGFAQITFKALPNNVYNRKIPKQWFAKGFKELLKVWKEIQHLPQIKKFLLSFGLFSLGTQTVMYMATLFGEEVVNMKMEELILLVLLLQLIAIPGAYFFSFLSQKKDNVFSLQIALLIWIGVCIASFFLEEGMKLEYYIIGIFVGLIMGGVQSMARSTYAKLIPSQTKEHASYFSFYETLEKISIALGAFIYGLVKYITNDLHYSSLVLIFFFISGFIVLSTMKKVKTKASIA